MKPLVLWTTLFFVLFFGFTARAETQGLPHNKEFPSASFPHARSLDGCTNWRRPSQLGDEWGSVSFSTACANHDRCFHTLGASWGECNRRFKVDLEAACGRDLKRARLEKNLVGEPDAESMRMCLDITNMYFAKAQKSEVIRRFKVAQFKQAEYLESVHEVLGKLFESLKERSPSKNELAQMFQLLNGGSTLEEISSALTGQPELDPAESNYTNVPTLED